MTESRGRILGIDYGKKRIGLALSDPMRMIATGLPTIVYQNLPDALKQLENIIIQNQVSDIVVGLPLTLKGEEGGAVRETKAFVDRLKLRTDLPIFDWDERFTSVMAQRSLREMGESWSRNKERVDQVSATILLQSYLDKHSLTQKKSL